MFIPYPTSRLMYALMALPLCTAVALTTTACQNTNNTQDKIAHSSQEAPRHKAYNIDAEPEQLNNERVSLAPAPADKFGNGLRAPGQEDEQGLR